MNTSTDTSTDFAPLGNPSKEERLPLSKKAVASIAAANSWEQDRIAQAIASGRRGWIAAGVGGVLALLGFSMATFQSLRPPPAPYPVVVDRTTGETSVVATLDASNVPALAALDQHNAAVFVRSRESYNFQLLQRDVRIEFERAIEVRSGDQMAQILPAGLVLGVERQAVDRPVGRAPNPQQAADNRLDSRIARHAGKSGHCVKTVAVGNRNGRKGAFLGQFDHRLGIDRSFEHRIAGHNAQGDETGVGHGG